MKCILACLWQLEFLLLSANLPKRVAQFCKTRTEWSSWHLGGFSSSSASSHGSAASPLSLQVWPKNETFGSLNCILSGFSVKLFLWHTSWKLSRFASCSWSVCPYHYQGNSQARWERFHQVSEIPAPQQNPLEGHPLKPSNIQCHCGELAWFRVEFHHPKSFVEICDGKLLHAMKLAKNLFDAPSVVGLMLQCLVQVSCVQADS